MDINKIPKGPLRTIAKEVISNARKLEIELEVLKAYMWTNNENSCSIDFEDKSQRGRINYFVKEREACFIGFKKGESPLVDAVYDSLGTNSSIIPCYVPR